MGFQPLILSIVLHILGWVLFRHANLIRTDDPLVGKIQPGQALMHAGFGHAHSPERIARAVGMGYTWFRRTFRAYVGMAPAQYQQTVRLNKARELLTTTTRSISEIAYALGFESVSAFFALFPQPRADQPLALPGPIPGRGAASRTLARPGGHSASRMRYSSIRSGVVSLSTTRFCASSR